MAFWAHLWKETKEYISDWGKSEVLSEHLENKALQYRKPVNEKLLKDHALAKKDPTIAQNYNKNLPAKPTGEEVLDAFLFSGLDYRGQAQHAFETLGYGAGISMGVDLAKMFLPPGVSAFTTLAVSGDFSAKKASHRFLLVSNQGTLTEFVNKPQPFQPKSGNDWRTKYVNSRLQPMDQVRQKAFQTASQAWQPVLMSGMLGKWTHIKGGLGVSAGVKFDSSSLFNIGIGDVEKFGFSVNLLTASAGGSYEGTWILATDPAPEHGDGNRQKMQIWLAEHLRSTGAKQALQQQVSLEVNPACYLSWWIQTKEATAGLSSGVGIGATTTLGSYKDQTIGPGAELKFSVKLPSIKWTAKTSAYRLNVPLSHPNLMLSQETKILYKQVGGQKIGLSLELEAGCAVVEEGTSPYSGKTVYSSELKNPLLTQKVDASSPGSFARYTDQESHGGEGKTPLEAKLPELEIYKGENLSISVSSSSLKLAFLEEKFEKVSKTWERVNSMTYEAAMAYWAKDSRLLLEGSGLAVGQTLSTPSLYKYFSNREQCKKLFNDPIPQFEKLRELALEATKAEFPLVVTFNSKALPSQEVWSKNSGTGMRRKISAVDDALKAWWKHLDTKPWNSPPDRLNPELLAMAKKNCGSLTGTTEENELRLYGQVFKLVQEEAKARAKLLNKILDGCDKWVASKGGDASAKANDRYLPVAGLKTKVEQAIKNLNAQTGRVDLASEYHDMRTLEKSLAEALHVGKDELQVFLGDESLREIIGSLAQTAKVDKSQLPGAFLIEASFKLPSSQLSLLAKNPQVVKSTGNDLEKGFGDVVKHQLGATHDGYKNALQYLALRYRLADTRDRDRSFKLGVSVGAAEFGFSLDRVRQAGTEGSVMLRTVWFGRYESANRSGGWPESTVPMPVILS